MSNEESIERSENVFEALGIPNAEEHQLKAQLVLAISRTLKNLGLNQTQTAKLLGIDQPQVSRMLRGHFDLYSVERLYRFLNRLGQDITVTISPAAIAESAETKVHIQESA